MTLVEVARSYLWVREVPPSSNRGPEIDRWLTALGSPLGSAWCAAFAYGCYADSAVPWPWKKSARVQDLVDSGTLLPADQAESSDLVVFWFNNLQRYAHIGIVTGKIKGKLRTIEANTVPEGATGDQREGYGIWERTRAISTRLKVLRAKP